jgi:hypothetical protein
VPVKPVCPAALPLAGPPAGGPAVVCGIVQREGERADEITHGAYQGQLITQRKDPSTLLGFCCGRALPVLHANQDERRAHHSNCPIWQLEKERIRAARGELEEAPRRGSTVPVDADGNPMSPVPDVGDAMNNLQRLAELAPPEQEN